MHGPERCGNHHNHGHDNGNNLGGHRSKKRLVWQSIILIASGMILRDKARRHGLDFRRTCLLFLQRALRLLTRADFTAGSIKNRNTAGGLSSGGLRHAGRGGNRHGQPGVTGQVGRSQSVVPVSGVFAGEVLLFPGLREIEVENAMSICLTIGAGFSTSGHCRCRDGQ